MPRRTCRSVVSTAAGDLDLRRHFVLAADVEGLPLGQVRSQQDLARLEAEHGRILVGVYPIEQRPQVLAVMAGGDAVTGWIRLLAGEQNGSWTTSRQGNARTLIHAAGVRAAGAYSPAAVRIGEDSSSTMTMESGQEVELPRPDRLRFPFTLPARDPGPGWSERFKAQIAKSDAPESLKVAGSMLAGRAWHLAADVVRPDLGTLAIRTGAWDPDAGPCPSPDRLLLALDSFLAVAEIRQAALFNLGSIDDLGETSDLAAEIIKVRERWLLAHAAGVRELLKEVRPFGSPSGASPFVSTGPQDDGALTAARQALVFLPSDWVAALPPIEVRPTDADADYAGLYLFNRSTRCAVLSVRSDSQLSDPVAVAAHELGHAAQLASGLGDRIRANEEAFLRSLPVVSAQPGLAVRMLVPGDDYAGVWTGADAGLPSEFLPQLLAWLAFDPSRTNDPSAPGEWSRRFWPGAPDALHLGLGILGSA